MINNYVILIDSRGQFIVSREDEIRDEVVGRNTTGIIRPDWLWSFSRMRKDFYREGSIHGLGMFLYPDKSIEIANINRGDFLKPGAIRVGVLDYYGLSRHYPTLASNIQHYKKMPLVNPELNAWGNTSSMVVNATGWHMHSSDEMEEPILVNSFDVDGKATIQVPYNRDYFVTLSQAINPEYLNDVDRIAIVHKNFSLVSINGTPMTREGNLWIAPKPEGECVLSIKVTEDPVGPIVFSNVFEKTVLEDRLLFVVDDETELKLEGNVFIINGKNMIYKNRMCVTKRKFLGLGWVKYKPLT